jgi:hypothetical protein
MNESIWTCERCSKALDLEKGEGSVRLTEDADSYSNGKITPLVPYENICYDCADELFALVEKCDKQCQYCEVTGIWGLSIMDCLKFQAKFNLLELPHEKISFASSTLPLIGNLRIFNRF